MEFKLSKHAQEEIERREIPLFFIKRVLKNPDQVIYEKKKLKKIFQSKIKFEDGKIRLLRVIVNENTVPRRVITVYCTSKIEKYWRGKNE